MVRSMFRTPKHEACTCPASVHLSGTTAKWRGLAKRLLDQSGEITNQNEVAMVGKDKGLRG